LGKAGESLIKTGKISGMGFRILELLFGDYNFVPKALFSFMISKFVLAKVLDEEKYNLLRQWREST
jgi:hypothetical protein